MAEFVKPSLRNTFGAAKILFVSALLFLALPVRASSAANSYNMNAPHVLQLLSADDFTHLESELFDLLAAKRVTSYGGSVFEETLDLAAQNAAKNSGAFLPHLNAWISRSPGSFMAYLMRGRFYKSWAWEARGDQYSDTVSSDSWQLFRDRLQLAKLDLERASALDPGQTSPYTDLIGVAMGLQTKEGIKYFNGAQSADRNDIYPYLAYVNSLMTKWGGDGKTIFAFAREAAAAHPDKPTFKILLIHAHVDAAQASLRRKDCGSDNCFKEYFLQPKVWLEVKDIMESILKAYPGSVRDHNRLAYFAYTSKHYTLAQQHIFFVPDDQWKEGALWSSFQDFQQCKNWLNQSAAAGQLGYYDKKD